MSKVDENLIRANYSELTKLLIRKHLSITTMESATSGQICSLITDTEGSSAIFKGALVTYSNETKIMQGVNPAVLEKYSVYSTQVAEEMAKICAEKFSADIGIGVTGTMGNVDPNNSEYSVPGKVFFAIFYLDKTSSFSYSIPIQESRYMYKLAVAEKIYSEIMKIL